MSTKTGSQFLMFAIIYMASSYIWGEQDRFTERDESIVYWEHQYQREPV